MVKYSGTYEPEPLPEIAHTYRPELQESILIERREIVAEIKLSDQGSLNPVEASYQVVAQYLRDNLQENQPISLQFNLFGHNHTITATPQKG